MREILEETQNRELSWLRFNQRVLEEARDETVPLMERMKFVAIFTSNLDEFFMIRVGSLYDMAAADSKKIDQRSGMTAKQQLDAGIIGNTAAVAVGGGKMLPQLRNGFSQQPVPIKGDLGKGTVYLLSKLIQPGYIHADQIILAAGGRLDHPVDIPQRGQDRQLQVDAGGFLEMRRQPGQSGGRGGGHGQYS